ncbi:Coq4 family protein [Trichormus sp. NMC-1]|uniref:Coq4 family protein n=1 Tax=Trichormus sp. NMC-1 TaxID=1853259 RepID=UPI0008DBF864|nr:Coq4 family protein [Trichormus sp. NMC-1]
MDNVITYNNDKGLLAYIQFLASRALKTQYDGTDPIFNFEDALDQTEIAQLAVDELKKNSEINALFTERWLPAPINLDELSQLPEGTLGNVYATEMKARGFDPNFYKKVPVVDDISYLKMLWRTTHDIYHVVAGFETDVLGELGLQAFVLAQTPIPISIMLVSFGMVLISLYQPAKLQPLMSEISRGYYLGSHTRGKFIAQKWDQFWDIPVMTIRAQLGMNPIPEN